MCYFNSLTLYYFSFLFKQNTADEMLISDWSSDVCSSDLDRAFSDRGDVIVELARAFRAGLNAQGLAATGKHFPGHGAVTADSHLVLPVDRRKEDAIRATELAPFKSLIDDGKIGSAHVSTPVTTAHLVCRLLLADKNNKNTIHNEN